MKLWRIGGWGTCRFQTIQLIEYKIVSSSSKNCLRLVNFLRRFLDFPKTSAQQPEDDLNRKYVKH